MAVLRLHQMPHCRCRFNREEFEVGQIDGRPGFVPNTKNKPRGHALQYTKLRQVFDVGWMSSNASRPGVSNRYPESSNKPSAKPAPSLKSPTTPSRRRRPRPPASFHCATTPTEVTSCAQYEGFCQRLSNLGAPITIAKSAGCGTRRYKIGTVWHFIRTFRCAQGRSCGACSTHTACESAAPAGRWGARPSVRAPAESVRHHSARLGAFLSQRWGPWLASVREHSCAWMLLRCLVARQ